MLAQLDQLSNKDQDSLSEYTLVDFEELEESIQDSQSAQSSWDHVSVFTGRSEGLEYEHREREFYKIKVSWVMRPEKGEFELKSPVYDEKEQESPYDILTFDWIYLEQHNDKLYLSYGNKENYSFSEKASILIYQLGEGEALVQWKKSQFQDFSSRSITQYPCAYNFLTSEQSECVWSNKIRIHSTKSIKLKMRGRSGLKLRISVERQVYDEIVEKVPREREVDMDSSSMVAVCGE